MKFGWCDETVSNLLTLSGSEYGFICEMLYSETGAPYLRSQATASHKKWDEKTQHFFDSQKLATLEFHNLNSLWGSVITTGKPVISDNPDTDPRRSGYPKHEGHPPLNSFLGLPIFNSIGDMVGVMGVANREGGYDESVINFLDMFVSTYGLLIEKSRMQHKQQELYDELQKSKELAQQLAVTDELTSLYNRRHFNVIAENELKRNRREKSPITLCMLDVDHFKAFNDTYGHQAGDDVLRQLGKTLKDTLRRPTDYAFRIGGEEFGILFSGLDLDYSLKLAEKIRLNIQNLHIPHEKNSASQWVTVSIGVIEVDNCSNGISIDTIYALSDSALYEAKESGRNQVVIHKTK